VIAYLDTNIVFWLCENQLVRLSGNALEAVDENDLLISPMVLIEMAYLNEVGRSLRQPHDIVRQLQTQLGLRICTQPFPSVAEAAVFETWTRDPFDRMIVAQAKTNGYAPLITADAKIRENYQRAIW
jgi:PIN domain nuclease of toxin-antitoxin system